MIDDVLQSESAKQKHWLVFELTSWRLIKDNVA